MDYVGGAAVRKLIIGKDSGNKDMQVLTTNESPPSEPIPFHHELAQTPDAPDYICFFCQVNDDCEGGSTPLIRSDMIYDYLNGKYPEFVAKIEELGVKYRRVAPEEDDASSALGRSWKSAFQCSTREEAETAAAAQGSTLEWRENGDCRIVSQRLPAVKVGSNGNKVFFNQVIAAYTGWIDSRNTPTEAVVFSDDTPLPGDILTDLAAYMDANKCAFTWAPGKFVIADNTLVMHSRQPFNGRRRVLAAIGKGTKPVTDTMPHHVLHSGDKLPMLGLGLWKMPLETCGDMVYQAI